MSKTYENPGPTAEEVAALPGAVLLEFGTDWCGFCRAASPAVDSALSGSSGISHIKVEDGKGRRLGRLFKVKLWPTLVFLKDGEEVARLVRPDRVDEVKEALSKLA